MINYTELKSAMSAAGYTVSPGDQWTIDDTHQYRQYCYFNHSLTPNHDLMVLAYPGIAPEGFPGTDDGPVVLQTLSILTDVALPVEGTAPVVVLAYYSNGTRVDITASATILSSNPESVATDGPTLAALSNGQATITASYEGLSTNSIVFVTDVPVTPVEESNTAPDARVLTSDGSTLAGSGIPSRYSQSVTDGLFQTFLIPVVAGLRTLGPGVNGDYSTNLAANEDFAFLFGIADVSSSSISAYTVALSITVNANTCTFHLEDQSGTWVWISDVDPDYIIDDSYSDENTVQNVTRLRFLKEGALISDDTGNVSITLSAKHNETEAEFTNVVTATVTKEA